MPGSRFNKFYMEENKSTEVDLAVQLESERQARLAVEDRLAIAEVEKDNYKTVALKRKGKLDNDDNFFGENDEADIERVIGGKVAQTQREREIAREIDTAKNEARKANEKLAEVLRAKDMKPDAGIGAAAGGGQEVKDGIFSAAQEAEMKTRWTKRGYSEEAQTRMLDSEKKSVLSRRSIS